MPYNPDAVPGHSGLGLVTQAIVSDVEGHFGAGFVLSTNVLLDITDQFGNAVRRGTQYSLTTTQTNGTVTSELIIHEPGIPYQNTLPDNATVQLVLNGSATYADFTSTFTILPNALTVQRVRFNFKEAYARVVRKRYL